MNREEEDQLDEVEREVAEWEAWKASPPAVLARQYAKGGLEFDDVGLKAFYDAAFAAGEQADREACAKELEAIANRIPVEQREGFVYKTVIECVAVIRARGEKK